MADRYTWIIKYAQKFYIIREKYHIKNLSESLISLIRLIFNYKNRGRMFYLHELYRPFLWKYYHRFNKDKIVQKKRDREHLYLLSKDKVVSRSIYIWGLKFINEQIETLIDSMKRVKGIRDSVDSDKSIIEIGGNLGFSTLCLAKKEIFKEIYSIEPDPENFSILKKNVSSCKTRTFINLFNIALSSYNGIIKFKRSSTNSGAHTTISEQEYLDINFQKYNKKQIINIKCSTFDNFINENNIAIDKLGLIWIDAEGNEGHILSASSILKKFKIPIYSELEPTLLLERKGLDLFIDFVINNYNFFIDCNPNSNLFPMSTSKIDKFIERLVNKGSHTDILLFS